MNDMNITDDDKLWALLSMVFAPLVGIIALLIEDKKSRPFIKYYAVQSIVLGVLSILLSGICIGVLVWVYGIYVGVKAYGGEMVQIPVITDFCRNQGWI
ncbi:MAG: hypothetical protein KA314_01335 [Chloroflexi bacterium]|nr:hypothetical protein [Chloroflexota bacterium]MBP8054450.1 hypothetical protein [Chloroflexota bacterium]